MSLIAILFLWLAIMLCLFCLATGVSIMDMKCSRLVATIIIVRGGMICLSTEALLAETLSVYSIYEVYSSLYFSWTYIATILRLFSYINDSSQL